MPRRAALFLLLALLAAPPALAQPAPCHGTPRAR
jgi:hypothetical protein